MFEKKDTIDYTQIDYSNISYPPKRRRGFSKVMLNSILALACICGGYKISKHSDFDKPASITQVTEHLTNNSHLRKLWDYIEEKHTDKEQALLDQGNLNHFVTVLMRHAEHYAAEMSYEKTDVVSGFKKHGPGSMIAYHLRFSDNPFSLSRRADDSMFKSLQDYTPSEKVCGCLNIKGIKKSLLKKKSILSRLAPEKSIEQREIFVRALFLDTAKSIQDNTIAPNLPNILKTHLAKIDLEENQKEIIEKIKLEEERSREVHRKHYYGDGDDCFTSSFG